MTFSAEEITEWKRFLSNELNGKTDKEVADYLIHLQKLDLSYLYTGEDITPLLLNSVCKLRQLHELDLVLNQIDTLPEQISQLQNLRILNLSQSWVAYLPETLCHLVNLQELYLSDCENLNRLPENMGQLQNLSVLDLGGECGNNLSRLPERIGELKNLKHLHLNCNYIETLPESIGELENLQTLGLFNYNDLIALPENIGKLKKLQTLDLYRCYLLTELPESICTLNHLQELNLTDCTQLNRLPENIGQLQQLKQLNLIGCENLHIFPQSIKQLKHCQIQWDIANVNGDKYQKLFEYMVSLQQEHYCFSFKQISAITNISVQYDLVDLWVKLKKELEKLPDDYPNENTPQFTESGCVFAVEALKKQALQYGYQVSQILLKEQTISFEKVANINGITSYEFSLWLQENGKVKNNE